MHAFSAGITVPRVISYRLAAFSSRIRAPSECCPDVQGQDCVIWVFGQLIFFFVRIFFTFHLLIALLFLVELWSGSSVHADTQ